MACGFRIWPCFCSSLCRPRALSSCKRESIGELSNTDCLGKGLRWISRATTSSPLLWRLKSYLGGLLGSQLKGGGHYILFLEGILQKLCDSGPINLFETCRPPRWNRNGKQWLFWKAYEDWPTWKRKQLKYIPSRVIHHPPPLLRV